MQQIEKLRRYTAEAEKAGVLHPAQLQIIQEEKWFHLFVPKEYGGLELSLPEAVRLEETIAYGDGSTGWVVTLCAGAAMFIGYFQKDLRDEVFANKDVCIAGSGKVNGTALPGERDFLVNGKWPYASGAPFADWLTANCRISGSSSLISSFIFKKEEVILEPTWNYIGLNATAGHSFSVKDTRVAQNRLFIISPQTATLPQPIYRFPFLQMAQATIAINIAGMCAFFFETAMNMIERKETEHHASVEAKEKGLALLKKAVEECKELKKNFYKQLDNSWSEHVKKGYVSSTMLGALSQSALIMAQRSRSMANEMFPYCGLTASIQSNIINQVWRNINTASQHSLML